MDGIRKKAAVERVRAIIIDSGRILLINRVKKDQSYWVMPGGQVEPKEDREQAVKRECIEELGSMVRVRTLFAQRTSSEPGTEGQQEFFYLCDMVGGKVGTGQGPEFQPKTSYKGEYRINWIDLKNLPDIDLKPQEIKDKIIKEYL
jgi:8-oxo-dGTP diphosphatase